MMLLAVVNVYIGIIAIVMPDRFGITKSVTLGSYLIIIGFIRLIIQLLEQMQNPKSDGRFYEDEEEK